MTLHEYLQGMKGKTAAVIGLGVSNRPLVELLARNGVKVIACDRKERAALGGAAAHYEALGAVLHLGEGYLRDLDADVVFRTPGMRPDVPELLEAKAHGAVITSEMEAFFAVCPCPIIGVTGSDGKTTTASVIAELLKAEGRRVWLGGNIGRPLLADAEQMTPDDLAVLELSSFQLMDMPYSPQVAVLTNLAPNHLDVHRDMAEYIASKENIYLHQSARDTAIFNADNAITRDLSGKAVGRARLFSRQEEVADGAFVRGGAIWLRDAAGEREVLPLADIPAGTMWKTIWRRSSPWTDLCAMRPSAVSRGSLPVWSTASSSCASCTASAITTIPSPPVPRAPSRGCAPSRTRSC